MECPRVAYIVWFGICLISSVSPDASSLRAQTNLCSGNLGDNIFSKGDFGSGPANVVQMDPGIAPGFVYTTQVPPDDGEYTLTNNINAWSFVYPTWLRIGDNDVNPNGYMMVVNASFAPGIFYEQQINNLCENTLYEFSADVINLIRKGTTGHILPNVSFLIDDALAYASGPIPQDENWHTYGFTFTTGPGQYSVKLSLRNNSPGGTGNDLALDNISFKACGPKSSATIEPQGRICENSVYPLLTAQIDADTGAVQWQLSLDEGMNWSDIPGATDRTHQVQQLAAGRYFFRYLYSNTLGNITNPKCSIVSDPLLVEVVPVQFGVSDTICEGNRVQLGDTLYGETGIYQHLFTAVNGCDSLVTLDLVVVPDPPITAVIRTTPTSCLGSLDGMIYVESVSGTHPPYDFFVNDILVPPDDTSILRPAGPYHVRIENHFGCFYEEEVTIENGPAFHIRTIEDTLVILGHRITLNTQSNLPVSMASWSPAEGITCPGCLSTVVMPVQDQLYTVEAVTGEGCIARDSVYIRVDRTPVIALPNIFSPNGDGINDAFTASLDPLNIPQIDEVYIFDRWGGVVSHKANLVSDNTIILWDGETPSGEALPATYVYRLQYTLADGTSGSQTGDVTLIR